MFYVELSCCVCMWHDKRLVASSINLLFFALCRWQGNSLLDPEKAETLLAFASWVRLFFLESISRVEQSLTIVSWLAGWLGCAVSVFFFSSFLYFFYRFVSRNFYDYFRGIGRRDYDCDCDWVCWWGTESSTECEWGQIVWPESRSGASPFKKARQTSRRGQQTGRGRSRGNSLFRLASTEPS